MNLDRSLADSGSAAPQTLDRRALLIGSSAAAAGLIGWGAVRHLIQPRARVFIAREQHYDGRLIGTIRDGLVATGLDPRVVREKRVLLKPNLVEPTRAAPHMTTHPAMVSATAHVFRQWGAHVTVGEAPGHVRDTEMALVESGLAESLASDKIPFADLNYEPVRWISNRGGTSRLTGFHFPATVVEADLIVSMPKLKTHHWVGVTAAMKNMYGVIPGIKYGWPKNVLHHSGISQTVLDINASLPQRIAVVDAIDCMEGDGPIMGTPKSMGLVLVGTNPTAVDATACRLMQVRPERIPYLQLAADRLGPITADRIEQVGEAWQPLASPFAILDQPHLSTIRADRSA